MIKFRKYSTFVTLNLVIQTYLWVCSSLYVSKTCHSLIPVYYFLRYVLNQESLRMSASQCNMDHRDINYMISTVVPTPGRTNMYGMVSFYLTYN